MAEIKPPVAPDLRLAQFADKDTKQIIAYLEGLVGDSKPAISKHHSGPVRPIYKVPQKHLPPLTAQIIRSIYFQDDRVVDYNISDWNKLKDIMAKTIDDDPVLSKNLRIYQGQVGGIQPNREGFAQRLNLQEKLLSERLSLNPDTPGAMRSWHQNDQGFLPRVEFDSRTLEGKPRLYQTYVETFKGLQNKQKGKGVEVKYTGYVEYTAGGWNTAVQSGRIAYNYVEEAFYLTPSHYQEWAADKNPWFLVERRD